MGVASGVQVARSSAAVLGYGEQRRRKMGPRSSPAGPRGGGARESNPPSSAWRHPPGLKPGRHTGVVAPPRSSCRLLREQHTVCPQAVFKLEGGKAEPVKDAEGNVWLADQGFEGGLWAGLLHTGFQMALGGRDPLGRGGDFVTAPEISQVFGELIGLWCAVVWQQMGSPLARHVGSFGQGASGASAAVPDNRKHDRDHGPAARTCKAVKSRSRPLLSGIGLG